MNKKWRGTLVLGNDLTEDELMHFKSALVAEFNAETGLDFTVDNVRVSPSRFGNRPATEFEISEPF